jgi:hypothetical protein
LRLGTTGSDSLELLIRWSLVRLHPGEPPNQRLTTFFGPVGVAASHGCLASRCPPSMTRSQGLKDSARAATFSPTLAIPACIECPEQRHDRTHVGGSANGYRAQRAQGCRASLRGCCREGCTPLHRMGTHVIPARDMRISATPGEAVHRQANAGYFQYSDGLLKTMIRLTILPFWTVK